MSGYSVKIVELNDSANPNLLGVQIGRLCISNNISVMAVAKYMDVSKATVYKWFSGKVDISKHLRSKAQAYYSSFPLPENPPCSY